MTEHYLRLSGLSCGSCERLIQRVVSANGGVVKDIDVDAGVVLVDYDGPIDRIKSVLAEQGFVEVVGKSDRGDFVRFFNYVSGVVFSRRGFEVESLLLNYSLVSSFVVFFISLFLYFVAFSSFHVLFLSFLIVLPLSFSFFHVKFYRRRLSCQLGMMVGMVSGMISGFLVGAFIGASNGMFFGSLLGVLAGVLIGLELGRCCGVMGVIEGLMAGIMSGVMGAMTSVMLYYEGLVVFLYFIFGLCILVLGFLSYMLYREAGSGNVSDFKVSVFEFVFVVVLFFVFLVSFALFGPKSNIVYVW
ncbi:MAG: heavy-metal-associated domain-containing protein [Candidatus Diapherotrites archaeon]